MRTFRLIAWLTVAGFLWAGNAFAQDDFLKDLETMKDPFKSQLPPPKVVVPPMAVLQSNNGRHESVPVNLAKPAGDPSDPSRMIPRVQPNTGPKPQESITIKGIVWNTGAPQAIVNDKIVHLGDTVNGMEIISIRQNGVEFSNNGVKVLIKMPDDQSAAAKKP